MATNAGEVRIRLAAQSAEFKASLDAAVRLMKVLQTQALQLNRILGKRISFPLTAQLKGVDRLLNRINASAAQVTRNLPRQLPKSFSTSLRTAATQVSALGTNTSKAITQANQGFTQAGRSGTEAFNSTTMAARRSSNQINTANRSLTLMIAKFALVVFAAQTLANIFDATFGAALRNIDDFEQGVVSTAASITNLADLKGGDTFGQAFAQNLEFVRGAFTELEVIAGNFFATATDLQLAFNTLAARGVVIRREEFNTLGLITDQIKLQTRGQVSSIQIAQELRNLFTGQVRAADQLGQLIKAQGGNVKEISNELRRTGSLAALEPFVAGLREAQGLFRGFLAPQLARFQALVERIGRSAFADVFRGAVGFINDINDGLDSNLGTIAGISNLVVNRLGRAFTQLLTVVSVFGRILLDIATNQIPLITVGTSLLLRRFGLIGAITGGIAAGIVAQKEGTDVLTLAFTTIGNVLRVSVLAGIKLVGVAINALSDPVRFIQLSLLNMAETALKAVRQIFSLVSKLPGLFGGLAKEAVSEIDEALFQVTGRKIAIRADIGKDSSGDTITDVLTRANAELEKLIKNANTDLGLDEQASSLENAATILGATQEELGKAIVAQATAEFQATGDFFPTKKVGGTDDDTDILKRILDAQRRLREAEARRNLQVDLAGIEARRNALNLAVASEITTEREAFDERRRLLVEETNFQLDAVDEQIQAEKDLAIQQRLRIKADADLSPLERRQQLELLNAQSATRITTLAERRLGVEQKLTNEIANQNAKIEETRIKTDRLLDRRQRAVDTSFVETVADRLVQVQEMQDDRLRELEGMSGVTPEQIQRQQDIGDQERLIEAISTPVMAALSAIDQAFNSLIDGILQGSLQFKEIAANIGSTLIKGGLQDALDGLKKALSDGLTKIFKGLGDEAAGQAAAALAVGIGLLLSVLSKSGNDASFTPGGAGGGGSLVESSQAVRGIIGGDTSIAIAEINSGLQEALIPTNNILATIERNTRSLAELNLNLDPDQLAQGIQDQISDILSQALLQVQP